MNRFSAFILLWLALLSVTTAKADTFVIRDIRIEGLQRISAGAVFNVFAGVTASALIHGYELVASTGVIARCRRARASSSEPIRTSPKPPLSRPTAGMAT